MSAVHDFQTSLAVSHLQADAPWWETVYRRAFPDFAAMHNVRQDGWAQRGGIDRQVILASGRVVGIDEKVRYEDYPDILLEYWSNYERRVEGWAAKPLATDYIAYAFVRSQRCYLLPADLLRRVLDDYGKGWGVAAQTGSPGFRWVKARNGTYTTVSVAVPTHVLLDKLADALVIDW